MTIQKVKLLIHGENGCIPFLSPNLLSNHFHPSTNDKVKQHLLLGIAIRDTCVTPTYKIQEEASSSRDSKDDSNIQSSLDPKVHSSKPDHNDNQENTSLFEINCNTNDPGNNNEQQTKQIRLNESKRDLDVKGNNHSRSKSDNQLNYSKPIGYTFQSKSIFQYMRLSPEYKTFIVPSFDLLDDLNQSSSMGKNQTPVSAYVSSNNHGVMLCTNQGMQRLSCTTHMELMKDFRLQKSQVMGLYDEIHASENRKRKEKCIQHNESWFQSSMSMLSSLRDESDQGHIEHDTKFFVPLVVYPNEIYDSSGPSTTATTTSSFTMTSIEQRMNSILTTESLSKQNITFGFSLIGLHHVSSRQDRIMILKQVKELRKANMNIPIGILTVLNITQILDAAKYGIDIIGMSFISSISKEKQAIMINSQGWRTGVGTDLPHNNEEKLNECGSMDVMNTIYCRDAKPLIPGCTCLSCDENKFSRAYIHHLIKAKELLADILLFGHNLHQMLLLFEEMSKAKSEGAIDAFCDYVEKQLS